MTDDRHDEFLRHLTAAQPAIRRFVLVRVPDFNLAEDILQDVSLVLWRKFQEFEPEGNFLAWAFGIARNEILHAGRSALRSRLIFTGELVDRIDQRLLEEHAPHLAQRTAALKNCLEKLSPRLRQTVNLKYFDGVSTAEIARTTGGTLNSIRILLCRARTQLANCARRQASENSAVKETW